MENRQMLIKKSGAVDLSNHAVYDKKYERVHSPMALLRVAVDSKQTRRWTVTNDREIRFTLVNIQRYTQKREQMMSK